MPMYSCIKETWLHWVALKIIIGDISLLLITIFPFSVPLFLPPSPSPPFPPSLSFSLFPFSYEASVFCFLLICCSSFLSVVLPSFLPAFFFSFLFCFFLFLLHVFLSSAFVHLPIIYLFIFKTPMDIMQCHWGCQGLRGLSSLLHRPLTIVTEGTDISIAVFVWSEFSTITQYPGY